MLLDSNKTAEAPRRESSHAVADQWAWSGPRGEDSQIRPDGVHFSRDGSVYTWRAWLLDIVLADDFKTILWPLPTDDDDASWELRRQVWEGSGAILGGSDAGAHLDRMLGSNYPSKFLGDSLRGRQLVSLERAVQMMTHKPAINRFADDGSERAIGAVRPRLPGQSDEQTDR